MREVKFRGKSTMDIEEMENMGLDHDNGWVTGSLINDTCPFIVGPVVEADQEYLAHEWWVPVDPETVGQFTGLKDKNGKEIYEKDILEDYYGKRYLVIWDEFMFNLKDYYDSSMDTPHLAFSEGVFKKVGDIYTNPELLNA